MECDICKEIKNKEVFTGDGCRDYICKACGNLTSLEVKVLQLKESRALKFYCTKCRSNDIIVLFKKIIADKETIIANKNDIILLLKNEIEQIKKLKDDSENKRDTWKDKSYADSVSVKADVKINIPSLIIKPKSVQDVERTKKDLQINIKPAELKIGIKNSKTIRNGGIVIKCSSINDVETFKKAAEDKLKDSYDIEITKMQKPKIKIVGYDGEKKLDEIQERLKRQNDWIEANDELKITYVKKRKDSTSVIYGECSSGLFHKFMNNKKIYIEWERYPVYEDLSIIRCFNCQEFFHKGKNCTNKKVCELCTGEHETKNCPKQVTKCKNCTIANTKYKMKYQTNNYASDRECPTFKYHIGKF